MKMGELGFRVTSARTQHIKLSNNPNNFNQLIMSITVKVVSNAIGTKHGNLKISCKLYSSF